MTDPTIHTDVENTAFDDDGFDPVAAFMKGLVGDDKSTEQPAKKRKEAPEPAQARDAPEENTEDTDPDADPEGSEDPDEDAEDDDETPDPKAAKKAVADDDEVEITVDGETRKASVKDLKRLYGQEAALTRKGQELSATRKAVEEQAQVYNTGLTKMKEAAEARWKEFEAVDYLLAKDRMDAQSFTNLREAATKAYQEYKFFDEELKGHAQKQQQEGVQRLQVAAKECVKALTSDVREDGSSNPHKIEGWNDTLYGEIRTFAVSELGADAQAFNTLVDPVAMKTLWMALQYAKAQKAAKTTTKPKPVVQAPKKVMSDRQAPEEGGTKSSKQKAALARLRSEGSIDAGADAFLASFGIKDE